MKHEETNDVNTEAGDTQTHALRKPSKSETGDADLLGRISARLSDWLASG